MANKYIINLPEKTTVNDSDIVIVEDAASTKRMTWANLVKPIKGMIGNLASLTTNHKATVVGAINELEAKNSFRPDVVTIASDDRAWLDMPLGVYYIGSNGISQGYPTDYGILIHTGSGVNLAIQICYGNGIVAVRRFNATLSMDWTIK